MKTKIKKQENEKKHSFYDKEIFELLSVTEKNINSLVKEAKCLLNNNYFARSFLLSYSALEELGKRLLICDYISGLVSKKEFMKSFRDHSLKIAYLHNKANLTKKDDGNYEAEIIYDTSKYSHWFIERNRSLYVDLQDGMISDPLVVINENYANEIFDYLLKNIKDTNYYEEVTGKIGSKSFYK